MSFETTAARLWKRLDRDERRAAAAAFFKQPHPELYGSALGAIVRARRLRPQVARALSVDEQAQALASVLDPGETLAAGLLVALHLAERRPLLAAFLDALGLPHEDGILKEDAELAFDAAALGRAASGVSQRFPSDQVEVYFNTLWLQDPERWAALAGSGAGLAESRSGSTSQ